MLAFLLTRDAMSIRPSPYQQKEASSCPQKTHHPSHKNAVIPAYKKIVTLNSIQGLPNHQPDSESTLRLFRMTYQLSRIINSH